MELNKPIGSWGLYDMIQVLYIEFICSFIKLRVDRRNCKVDAVAESLYDKTKTCDTEGEFNWASEVSKKH